ncbi:MAG: hypothetical protein QXI33_02155 [Candidatus Pacearchaeota archaeon]
MAAIDSVTKIIEDKLKIKPSRTHELTYDSSTETLEPIYFWIVDFMNSLFRGKVEKLTDNFTSSPGGGHFSELNTKKTIMQENVSKTLGAINQVVKSIVNLVYDLKDFEIRLEHYNASKSNDKTKKEAGILALKQIWMDNVDIKRGRGSINMLAQDLEFVTIRDAFMIINSVEDVEKLDLNERVKRILKPRIAEFLEWKKMSEDELRKRYNIEKNYLKSQVNTLQLYSRWVKPYLKAATDLEMKELNRNPEIVNAFNTIVLELTLMGKKEVDVKEEIKTANLPKGISIPKRNYYSVVIVDFHFRGIPQKAGQHYVFGGKATVTFKAYALNEDELNFFEQELKKSDVNEVMKYIEGATTESIDILQKDIDYFLKSDEEKKKDEEEKRKNTDINPFSALFGIFKRTEKKTEKKEISDINQIKKDSYSEKLIRKIANESSSRNCFTIYDIYKKSHGMASHENPYE